MYYYLLNASASLTIHITGKCLKNFSAISYFPATSNLYIFLKLSLCFTPENVLFHSLLRIVEVWVYLYSNLCNNLHLVMGIVWRSMRGCQDEADLYKSLKKWRYSYGNCTLYICVNKHLYWKHCISEYHYSPYPAYILSRC